MTTHKHNGVISDRLRKLFGPNDPAWTPPRVTASKPMPKTGVEGHKLGKAGRKVEKK